MLPGGAVRFRIKTPLRLVQQMEATFGLNRPIYEQYAIWLGNVAQLKRSLSLVSAGQDGGELSCCRGWSSRRNWA